MNSTPVTRHRKKAIPLHFQKRSSSSVNRSQTSRRKLDLSMNNRSLALALQEARTELALREERLLQQAETINRLQLLRTQVEVAVSVIDGAVSNLKEALKATYETEQPGVNHGDQPEQPNIRKAPAEQPLSIDECKKDLLNCGNKYTRATVREQRRLNDAEHKKEGLRNGSVSIETIFEAPENLAPRKKTPNPKIISSKIPTLGQCQTLKRKNLGSLMTDKNYCDVVLNNDKSRQNSKNLKTSDLELKRRETFVIARDVVIDSKLEILHDSESKIVSETNHEEVAVVNKINELESSLNDARRKTFVVKSVQKKMDFPSELSSNDKSGKGPKPAQSSLQSFLPEVKTSHKATSCDTAFKMGSGFENNFLLNDSVKTEVTCYSDVVEKNSNLSIKQCLKTNFGTVQENAVSTTVLFSSEQKTVDPKYSEEDKSFVIVHPCAQVPPIEYSMKQSSEQLNAKDTQLAMSVDCPLEFQKIDVDDNLCQLNKTEHLCDLEKTVTNEQNVDICPLQKRRTFASIQSSKQICQVSMNAAIQEIFMPLENCSVEQQGPLVLNEKPRDLSNKKETAMPVSSKMEEYLAISKEVDVLLSQPPSVTPPIRGVIPTLGKRKNRYNLIAKTYDEHQNKKTKRKSTICKTDVQKVQAEKSLVLTETSFVEKDKLRNANDSSQLEKTDKATSSGESQFHSTEENCVQDRKLTLKSVRKISQGMTTDKNATQSSAFQTQTTDCNKKIKIDQFLLENILKDDVLSGLCHVQERNCEASSREIMSQLRKKTLKVKPTRKSFTNDVTHIPVKGFVTLAHLDNNANQQESDEFKNKIPSQSDKNLKLDSGRDECVKSFISSQTNQHDVCKPVPAKKIPSPKTPVNDVLNNENSNQVTDMNSFIPQDISSGKRKYKGKTCGISSGTDILDCKKAKRRSKVQKQKSVVLKETDAYKTTDPPCQQAETPEPNEIPFSEKEVLLISGKVCEEKAEHFMQPENKVHGDGNVTLKVCKKRQNKRSVATKQSQKAKKTVRSRNLDSNYLPASPPSPCVANLIEEITECSLDQKKCPTQRKKKAPRGICRRKPPKGNKENINPVPGNTSEKNEFLIVAEVHEPPKDLIAVPVSMQPSVVLMDFLAAVDLPKVRKELPVIPELPRKNLEEDNTGEIIGTKKTPPRRNRKPVRYKEPKLNKKMRRS